MEEKEISLLLIGETGMGKSSFINLLYEKELAKVYGSAESCTKNTETYTYFSQFMKQTCFFIDTVGFNDTTGLNSDDN